MSVVFFLFYPVAALVNFDTNAWLARTNNKSHTNVYESVPNAMLVYILMYF